MTGTLEFTSATYYRYVGLNLDLLSDAAHLGALSSEERKTVVDTFLRAASLGGSGRAEKLDECPHLAGLRAGSCERQRPAAATGQCV